MLIYIRASENKTDEKGRIVLHKIKYEVKHYYFHTFTSVLEK